VNPDVKAGGHPHIATGLQQHKIRRAWPEARRLYLEHRNTKAISWQGSVLISVRRMSNLLHSAGALQRLAGYLLYLRQQGIVLKILDVGGGLGVRYTGSILHRAKPIAKMIADVVRLLVFDFSLSLALHHCLVIAILLSRVIYTKQNSRKSFVIVDAAHDDLMASCALRRAASHHARCAKPCLASECGKARRHRWPRLRNRRHFYRWPLEVFAQGDLVAIWVTGAYGFAQSSNYMAAAAPLKCSSTAIGKSHPAPRNEQGPFCAPTSCVKTTLRPLQLIPQISKYVCSAADQFQPLRRQRDSHVVPDLHGHAGLPVQCYKYGIRAF